ncbi:MAG: hypothetical protein ACON4T_01520 [Synechococcus sp.]
MICAGFWWLGGVCAAAAAFKFARLARAMRGTLDSQGRSQPDALSTQAMREQLERLWQRQ